MPYNLGSERPTVQDPLIRYAVEIGWGYLSPGQALTFRRGESGTLLYPTLRDKLVTLNPGVVTVENVDQIINTIESVRNNIEGNAEILAWLRGKRAVYIESEKRHRNVKLIDFEHPAHNVFHVTDEWQYTNGRYTNRADVLFLVNGVPLALVETKGAGKEDAIEIGLRQVRRYHRETPEMLTAPQVFDVTDLIHFYYGVTWNLDLKDFFNWKEEEKRNFEKKIKRFFARERFLKLIGEWIIFFKKDDELQKIVLRQHQTRAVDKVVDRVLDPEKRTGLIWHTQGSGKTFTMIKAAEQILGHPAFEKPTVIILVDRNELEGQLSGWITSVLGEGKAEPAYSKQRLSELLRSDYRGLIISMIHKFDKADADLCIRDNVFILVDEAHRTTSGHFGNYLVGALPNATLIGFTGTPIDKIAYGKGTFKVFGKDDPQGYLDKYNIAESIEDGTTLRINYTLASNDIRVPREQLEKEFLDLAETEGISDIEDLNKILDRAINLKAFLKSRDRINKVALFVSDHFKKNVEPLGYKAFLVAVDREACALYKNELDQYLPQDYSTVVYTSVHNDDELLAQFRLGEDQEKAVRKDFRNKDVLPKILIVTEKLLTGFDAPVLYCMYLDKPMRDHTLLQAIARVNRPFEEEGGIKKPAGFVVDFIGIFEKLEKALAFDSDVVQSVIQNIDVLKERFAVLITDQAIPYLRLCKGPVGDKAVERAIDAFDEKEKRDVFFKFFRELEALYEIISPDIFLREYLEDYRNLSILYEIVLNAFSRRGALYGEIAKKTENLVRDQAKLYGLGTTMPLVTIDENTLKALNQSRSSDPSKVINLGKSLIQSVIDKEDEQPFLIPISDRAEAVLESYDDRQINTQGALRQLESLLDEYLQARKEYEESGFDINTFTIFWILKQAKVEKAQKVANLADGVLKQYPNYSYNSSERRRIKAELYKVLLSIVGKDRMVELVDKILKLRRK